MIHVERLAIGLQELLCEGRFVDVRICCSDHSPSDGLGAHRAMLAAASPRLLGPWLQSEECDDEMVCLHLPDYTSSCVASVLSLLYYGETWIHCTGHQDQLDTINSLLDNLGVSLEVIRDGTRLLLRKKTSSKIKKQKIKKEPIDTVLAAPLISPAKIKKEKFEQQYGSGSSGPVRLSAQVSSSAM